MIGIALWFALIAGAVMAIGGVAGIFMAVSMETAVTYLVALTILMILFAVLSARPEIEDAAIAFGLSFWLYTVFHLHPVFNMIIFFVSLSLLIFVFEKMAYKIKFAKGFIFSLAYVVIGWVVIYQTMHQLDNIWKTFFFILFLVFVITARKQNLDDAKWNFESADIDKQKAQTELNKEKIHDAEDLIADTMDVIENTMVKRYMEAGEKEKGHALAEIYNRLSHLNERAGCIVYEDTKKVNKFIRELHFIIFFEFGPKARLYRKDIKKFEKQNK